MKRFLAVLSAAMLGVPTVGLAATLSEATGVAELVPSQPLDVSIARRNKSLAVAFAPPESAGTSPVSSYTVSCRERLSGVVGGQATGTSSPLVIDGLVNGRMYECSVVASNEFGDGESSAEVVAAPTAVVPGQFSDPVDLSASCAEASGKIIDSNARGDAIVVWACPVLGVPFPVVYAAHRSAGGDFGVAVEIGTTNSHELSTVIDASGAGVVAFSSDIGGRLVVRAASFNTSGGFESTIDLTPAGAEGAYPDASINDRGDAIVSWYLYTGSEQLVASLRPAGGTFGSPVVIAPGGIRELSNDVGVDNQGKALVAWTRDTLQLTEVDIATSEVRQLPSISLDVAYGPHLAVAGNGQAVIFYKFRDCSWCGYAVIRDASGSFGTPVRLTDARVEYMAAEISDDGYGVVSWSDFSSGQWQMYAAVRPVDGSLSSPVVLGDGYGRPRVAVDDNHRTIIGWYYNISDAMYVSVIDPLDATLPSQRFAASVLYSASVTVAATPTLRPPVRVGGARGDGFDIGVNHFGDVGVVMTHSKSGQVGFTESNGTPVAAKVKFRLAAAVNGSGSGAVKSTPIGINCGSKCYKDFDAGKTVKLTATPSRTSTFTKWRGACTGTKSTCTVSMTKARSVTATFTLKKFALTVRRAGTGTGTVKSSPSGVNCGSTCAPVFNHNTKVTLTATPSRTSTFTGWTGACTGKSTCKVTMSQARSVTATFTKK